MDVQDGFAGILERLAQRVRAGELRVHRYEAVAATREEERDGSWIEVVPTGEVTLTFHCQQAPPAATPAKDNDGRRS